MSVSTDTKYIPGVDFDVYITKKNGRFILRVPERDILLEGDSVNGLCEALNTKFLKDPSADRLEQNSVLSGNAKEIQHFWNQLAPFILKAAMVFLLCTILMVSTIVSIIYTLETVPNKITKNLEE